MRSPVLPPLCISVWHCVDDPKTYVHSQLDGELFSIQYGQKFNKMRISKCDFQVESVLNIYSNYHIVLHRQQAECSMVIQRIQIIATKNSTSTY